jgi:hypothetical protein
MHRTIPSLIVFVPLAIFAAASSKAAPYEFAQFSAPAGGQLFTLTDNTTSENIAADNIPVIFNFTAATGLSTKGHPAFLNINPVTVSSTLPAVTAGSLVDQPLNLVDILTLRSGMNGTGVDYLTMTFTGDIVGLLGGPGAGVLGADNNPKNLRIVTYTSDFGGFDGSGGNSYSLALQDISPPLSAGAGGFLAASASNITGQFSGGLPEPASAVLFGVGVLCFGLMAVGRIRSPSSDG